MIGRPRTFRYSISESALPLELCWKFSSLKCKNEWGCSIVQLWNSPYSFPHWIYLCSGFRAGIFRRCPMKGSPGGPGGRGCLFFSLLFRWNNRQEPNVKITPINTLGWERRNGIMVPLICQFWGQWVRSFAVQLRLGYYKMIYLRVIRIWLIITRKPTLLIMLASTLFEEVKSFADYRHKDSDTGI